MKKTKSVCRVLDRGHSTNLPHNHPRLHTHALTHTHNHARTHTPRRRRPMPRPVSPTIAGLPCSTAAPGPCRRPPALPAPGPSPAPGTLAAGMLPSGAGPCLQGLSTFVLFLICESTTLVVAMAWESSVQGPKEKPCKSSSDLECKSYLVFRS